MVILFLFLFILNLPKYGNDVDVVIHIISHTSSLELIGNRHKYPR